MAGMAGGSPNIAAVTFYDRGSTFPRFVFLDDGVPSPKMVGISNLVLK